MALTVTKIAIVDPSRPQLDFGATALDATVHTVDIAISATTDYSSGIDLTSATLLGSAGINCSQVIGVLNTAVRSSGGTSKPYHGVFNQNTKKLQLMRGSNVLFTNAVQKVGVNGTQTTVTSGNAFTLKANTLSANGMGIRFRFWGTKTTAAEAGTIQVVIGGTIANPPVGGSTVINLVTTANGVAQHWYIQGDLIRTGAATQQCCVMGIAAADNTATLTNKVSDALFSALTLDLTTDLTVLPTVNATTGTTCTIEGQVIELIGATAGQGIEIQPTTDLAASDVIRCSLVCV